MIELEINILSLRERTAEDAELAIDLLNILREESFNYRKNVDIYIDLIDYQGLASELHKMKSAVAVLGFDRLSERIISVEKNAQKKIVEFDYRNEINIIFISLNEHIIELEKILKK